MFSATYVRKSQRVEYVEGQRLFSFCPDCDGPEAADQKFNIYAPARLSFSKAGLVLRPIGNSIERTSILKQFLNTKEAALVEFDDEKYISTLETSIRAFLRVK